MLAFCTEETSCRHLPRTIARLRHREVDIVHDGKEQHHQAYNEKQVDQLAVSGVQVVIVALVTREIYFVQRHQERSAMEGSLVEIRPERVNKFAELFLSPHHLCALSHLQEDACTRKIHGLGEILVHVRRVVIPFPGEVDDHFHVLVDERIVEILHHAGDMVPNAVVPCNLATEHFLRAKPFVGKPLGNDHVVPVVQTGLPVALQQLEVEHGEEGGIGLQHRCLVELISLLQPHV